jgi:hypothetical protein
VNTIGTQAFTNCPELTDVYCYAENVPNMKLTDYLSIFYTDAFYGSLIEYATLHVPTQSIDAYKSKEPWKKTSTSSFLSPLVLCTAKASQLKVKLSPLKMASLPLSVWYLDFC